jgi:hypothetical protein
MPQHDNTSGHDYEMPSMLAHALVSGTTWALSCSACARQIVVDVVELVARYDVAEFDPDAVFARAKCKHCGGRLKQTGGYEIDALQHRGQLPRLITADGSDWRRPVSRGSGGPALL